MGKEAEVGVSDKRERGRHGALLDIEKYDAWEKVCCSALWHEEAALACG